MVTPSEVLAGALKDVEDADVPDDLRQIAFAKAFELRAGTGAVPSPTAPAPQAAGMSTHPVPVIPGGGDPLGMIAERVGVDQETVGEVFTVHDDEVELVVSGGKLSTKTATATKQIALLVAGGRQAGGTEDWTAWDEIRKVCADFRRLDSGNFAKTMRELDSIFLTRKRSDRKMLVRMSKPGWDEFAVAVRRLGAGE